MDIGIEINNLITFINTFRGLTIDDLCCKLNFFSSSKSRNALLIKRIEEGYRGKSFFNVLSDTGHLLTKTIQLVETGRPKEAMSFPVFDYEEIVRESWENSQIREVFLHTFIFCVFQKKQNDNVFCGAFLWKMPEVDLSGEVKEVWAKTRNIIASGKIVQQEGERTVLNFPKEAETHVCHVRPHGRNKLDCGKLPKTEASTNYVGLPKQSFWLNHEYINAIVREHKALLDCILYN